jgi:hypothetical protein
MYRRDSAACSGPTFVIHQVDDFACGAASFSDCDDILDGIGSAVTFI